MHEHYKRKMFLINDESLKKYFGLQIMSKNNNIFSL